MIELKDLPEPALQAVLFLTEQLAARAPGAPRFAQTDFSKEDDAEPEYIEEARRAAREYATSKREGKRPRTYAQDTELQREGVKSALDWLRRKRPRKQ
jgi:hypothetical protein